MTAEGQLLLAAMAFLGATIAQIVSHALQLRREKAKDRREALAFVDMMIADLDYAALNMASVIRLLAPVPEHKGWHEYPQDSLGIILIDNASSHYKLGVGVIPSLVNRVRERLQVANGMLLEIKNNAPCKIDMEGRYRLIDYFHAVLRLSVVLEEAKVSRRAGWTEQVGRAQVLDKWETMQLYIGQARVTRGDVAAWLAEIDAARSARLNQQADDTTSPGSG